MYLHLRVISILSRISVFREYPRNSNSSTATNLHIALQLDSAHSAKKHDGFVIDQLEMTPINVSCAEDIRQLNK